VTNDAALVIMAKQPVVGRTKTRLVPFLTPSEAARLYEALLLDTIALAVQLASLADLAIAVTPPEGCATIAGIAPPSAMVFPVDGFDIGACLQQALGHILEQGYRKALAIASDGPSLPAAILRQAVTVLDDADLVLGPGEDGGYYLVGMKRPYWEIFEQVHWSTDRVLRQTLERAADLDLRVCLLPPWYDVDTPDDLLRLQADLHRLDGESLANTRAILALLTLETRPR
jgi:rSAM/selenodomain-associated transferase 1